MEAKTETSQSDIGRQISPLVGALEKISGIAEKGPVILLLALGALMILFTMLSRIELTIPSGTARLLSLSPSEFITLVISATLLLALASSIRLYQFREQQKILGNLLMKEQERSGELLSKWLKIL